MAKKKRIALVISFVLFLSSCGSQPRIEYIYQPVEVKVPVMVRPEIESIKKPDLDIYALTENSSEKEVVEAYYNSLRKSILYSKRLEEALEPFMKKE